MKIKEDDYRKAILRVGMDIYDDIIPVSRDIEIILYAAKKQIGENPVLSSNKVGYCCPSCNKPIYASDRYCSRCGQKIRRINK